MPKRHRLLQCLLVLTLLPVAAGANEEAGQNRPNIVFLLTDDQRYDTLGATGNSIVRTPEIDRLARDGVTFDRSYVVSSACAPNRAAILSGMYTRSSGVRDFSADFPEAIRDALYPFVLKEHGYHIGFIGKWGVAATIESNLEPYRERFDFWRGFVGQGNYYTDERSDRHMTRVVADQAKAFLEGAPDDRPFALSVSFKAPHGPWDGYDRRFEDAFKDADIPYPETLNQEAVDALPDFLRTYRLSLNGKSVETLREVHPKFVRQYYRLILGVDKAVGRIREALREQGVAENTIIIFTSDNGHFLHEWGFHGKWLMYEPSIHVPLIVHDPRLPEPRRGAREEPFALSIDLAPTMLDYAGAPIPGNMQGRSLRPIVRGETPEDWRQSFFYDYNFGMYPGDIPRSIGVRTDAWKYVRYTATRPQHEQLFDMRNDPLETNNLAGNANYRSVLERMRERVAEYRDKLPDRVPDYHEYADRFDVIGIGSDFPDSQVDFNRVRRVGQTFPAKSERFVAVEWRWPYFIREHPPMGAEVILRRGGPNGEILGRSELEPESIYNLNLARAKMPVEGLTVGETLYVEVKAPEKPDARGVMGLWYYSDDVFPGGRAYFGDRAQSGDFPMYFAFEETE